MKINLDDNNEITSESIPFIFSEIVHISHLNELSITLGFNEIETEGLGHLFFYISSIKILKILNFKLFKYNLKEEDYFMIYSSLEKME